jgi:hypothetical protein
MHLSSFSLFLQRPNNTTMLTTHLVATGQLFMLTTSVLGPGEKELEEFRSQSSKLTQTMQNWKLTILPIVANASPASLTPPATNRQEMMEQMRTSSDNSPQASPRQTEEAVMFSVQEQI